MGMLTKQERDALEDIFSSIDSGRKYFSFFSSLKPRTIQGIAKYRQKSHKKVTFFNFFNKKKKILSK